VTAPPVAAVEIAGGEGVILRGQRWPGSNTWVVLLHEPGDDMDLDRWLPLAPYLAAREWSVLAVDLRGHGASEGEWDPTLATADLTAVIDFARGEGATFVAIAGARESAITALRSAAATRPDAMVLLSPTLGPDDDPMTLRGVGEAKLIAAGGLDPEAWAEAERLRKVLIGWGMLLSLPAAEQGTALLSGALAGQLREHITGFLAEQRFLDSKRKGVPHAATPGRAEPDAAASAETEQRRHE
jgi:pimeloyl-ACP methyl ester carboxylesterase